MIRKIINFIIRLIIILAVLGFVLYRIKFAPISVSAFDVRRGPVIAEVMGTGTLTAHTKTTISPKIQGRLVELTVDQNDAVTTGQLLARLDDADLREQVAIAKAYLEVAQASLKRAQAEEERAKAVITQSQLDYMRNSKLADTGAVATSDMDKSREQLQVAEAEGARAGAAVIEAQKQIVAADKTLRYHDAKLTDTRIYSPFNGLITRRDRDPGDIIVPGASIFQLISTREIWISAWVDESAMTMLRSGQKARLAFRSNPQKNYSGTVVRISREVDRESREFLVDVSADQLPQNWAIGQRAEVFIQTGKKDNVVQVPRRLIRWRDGNPGVFVNVGGKANWRNLKLGITGGEFAEVESGIAAGDKIITAPDSEARKLQPGRRVVIEP